MSKPAVPRGLELRGKTWHIDITSVSGQRHRQSCRTSDLKAAKELLEKVRAEVWSRDALGIKQPRSIEEACVRFLDERKNNKPKAVFGYKYRAAFWCQRGAGMALSEIKRSWALEQVKAYRTKAGKEPSFSTCRNYLAFLSVLMKGAKKDWEWLDEDYTLPDLEMPPLRSGNKPPARGIAITPAQAQDLLNVLPAKWQAPVAFGFLTGLRKSNIFGLHWDHVSLTTSTATIDPDQAKAGKKILVPLNSGALEILFSQAALGQQGKVFKDSYPKNTQWKRFVAKAGLPAGFRFHDIRHTFATWLSQSGVERKTVQELAGWNSSSMLDNYVHLPSSHLAAASEGLFQLFTPQLRHKEQIRQLEKVA